MLAILLGWANLSAAAEPPATPDGPSWRENLRVRLMSEAVRERYGLHAEDLGPDATSLAVLIHGYNSNPSATDKLIAPARMAGIPCAVFAYPNDQSLGASADLLSSELRELRREHPDCRVALVTHSMGGLVARAVVEDPERNPGNVRQLIMVSPPTHGSMLAKISVATDLWEHWLGRRSGGPWRRTRDAIVDGLGEAATDLQPGSDFLTALNERPRNPGIEYTLIVGDRGAMSEERMNWLRAQLRAALGRMRARDTALEVDHAVAQWEELVEGKGDGVVAVNRARLEGVADTVVLPFGHLDVTSDKPSPGAIRARRLVLSRLMAADAAEQ